jgi:hypothetical protein
MKRVYMTISNEGSSTKSTTAKYIKEMLMRRGLRHKTYLCDKDHTELIDTYGDEVQYFNIRDDHEALINILGDDVEHIIVDFPASSLDELYKVFKSMQAFVQTFMMFGAIPYFVLPVISDKSMLSINRLGSLLSGVAAPTRKIYVLAEGAMKNQGEVHEAFSKNESANSQYEDGSATIVTLKTIFTPNFAQIVKKEKLREFLTKKGATPMNLALMHQLTRETDSMFASALGLEVIDDRTEMEKGLKIDTTVIARVKNVEPLQYKEEATSKKK